MKQAEDWVKGFFPKTETIRGEQYMLVGTLMLMAVFMLAYRLVG